ncbi:hypothetical protein GLAREA_05813 [Glarea lozoyensis ATCC 20868]|uniref:Zn(2)-C6 fungal-type domain-containing protein n=1 Tax=Glarea lozoyensis (strain ATCC 20868 / MF5171) TaxID=1116229 RepID=S3DFD0_GLAL2|nr:uncharacterized protein GLAREA_05813 [Glarea lozoyensis ATCC 20868]EPE36475.1 hypothetical protein GLAREA_05813 [Glarea lozoyensis ATCC 20868]
MLIFSRQCDESKPSCLNCVTAELCCKYQPGDPTFPPGPSRQTTAVNDQVQNSYPAPEPQSSNASTTRATSHASSPRSPVLRGANMLDLELLHHMSSVTCKEFRSDGNEAREAFDTAISYALDAPFLMHELLAISALHLSTLRPNWGQFYHNKATELQTHAVSLYTNQTDSGNPTSHIAAFMFSSYLGIHVLFDTLLFRPTDFTLFVERFVGYLRLHRGVKVVSTGAWSLLRETELRSLLSEGNHQEAVGKECDAIHSLSLSADMSQISIEKCLEAVTHLQWVFDCSGWRDKGKGDTGEGDLIFSWPVTISLEFTNLLLQNRPEALSILAHYAVLLHWRRDLWIVRDGGRFLIESIKRYLGSFWEQWLAFPISALQVVDD